MYASLKKSEEKDEGPARTAPNLRRSARNRPRKDYKAIQEGTNQLLSEGTTDFSAHVASETHEKSELRFSVLCTEENWFKRGVKEAVAIKKIQPTLNRDQGRHKLSPIYDQLIRNSVVMTTSRTGAKDGSEVTDF